MSERTGHSIRSFRSTLLVAFALFFGTLSLFAQVKTTVDTTTIRIGEEIKYTLEVEADTTSLVLFPEGKSFGALEVIESYKVDTNKISNRYKLIKRYGLTQFDSGAYRIPSQRVLIDDRPFDTDSIDILVQDVPVDTTQQKMFDIKPVIEVDSPPFDFIRILSWVLALLVVVGGILYFLRRKKLKEERDRQLPPYEEAITALQQLDQSTVLEERNEKAYYSSLTEIVKRYIDREVDDRALESTTDELIERLLLHKDSGHYEFSQHTIKKLEEILKRADLVKFAKMHQEVGQLRADRSTIEEVINETKEALPEPTEEELLQDELYREALERKRKRQRIVRWSVASVAGLFLIAAVSIGIFGWETVRDSVFGNEMKDLAESRWYRSEYGTPAVIIETPEILKRIPDTLSEIQAQQINANAFTAGSLRDPFYVSVFTYLLPSQQTQMDLNTAMDNALIQLEAQGAKNMVVKRDEFETEKGIKGLRAHGDFNVQVSEKRMLKEKSVYELLIFAQQGGVQSVLIVYQDDGKYAEDIKERILNSVELEVTEQTAQNTEP